MRVRVHVRVRVREQNLGLPNKIIPSDGASIFEHAEKEKAK